MDDSFEDDVADQSGSEQWNRHKSLNTDSGISQSDGFECNICLETVQDPVVTLCGHLYCWPCIYRWLESPGFSSDYHENHTQQCPVCKSEVSQSSLIPLYSRGQAATNSSVTNGRRPLGAGIPGRPLGPVYNPTTPMIAQSYTASPPHTRSLAQELYGRGYRTYTPHPSQPYFSSLRQFPGPATFSSTTMSIIHPIVGIFGETGHARIFGNSMTNVYAYPNMYPLAGASQRIRRLVMQADKSLSRICFFLLCCCILCLLLF